MQRLKGKPETGSLAGVPRGRADPPGQPRLEVGSGPRHDIGRSPNGERKVGARFIVHSSKGIGGWRLGTQRGRRARRSHAPTSGHHPAADTDTTRSRRRRAPTLALPLTSIQSSIQPSTQPSIQSSLSSLPFPSFPRNVTHATPVPPLPLPRCLPSIVARS